MTSSSQNPDIADPETLVEEVIAELQDRQGTAAERNARPRPSQTAQGATETMSSIDGAARGLSHCLQSA